MTIAWPSELTPSRGAIGLRGSTFSGGRSITGFDQRITSDAGFWEIRYDIAIRTKPQVNAARAMMARLRNGEEIAVTIFDRQRPALDGADSGTLTTSPAARATSLSFSATDAQISAGQHFTIAGRLYIVTEVTSETASGVGLVLAVSGSANWSDSDVWVDEPSDDVAITFLPPLRAAATSGDTIHFDALACLCVIADPNDGDLDLDQLRAGALSLTFRESI